MFGVAPTVISCRLHRRWLDVNLSEPNAFTDAKMAPYYHAYYAAVLSAIQHAWKVQRRSPLIISMSAHHAFSETIYISTLNGKTVAGMRERGEGGDPRFTNEGLNARLSASRFTVSIISVSEPSANRKPHVACTSLKSQPETHARLMLCLTLLGTNQQGRSTEILLCRSCLQIGTNATTLNLARGRQVALVR